MLWLALSYPALPLEVFGNDCINSDKPTVVLETDKVIFCNLAARKINVQLGSNLVTAQAITEDVIYFYRDLSLEKKHFDLLSRELCSLSNQISIQSDRSILLEIGCSLRLFGSVEAIVQMAIGLSMHQGCRPVSRVAETPYAALALAYSKNHNLSEVPVIEAGLSYIGISEQTINQITDMGINTLGELSSLPAREIGKRLGNDVLRYLNKLTGKTSDLRKRIGPAKDFTDEIHCLQAVMSKSELYQGSYSPIRVLLEKLHQWLRINQLGCDTLRWTFEGSKSNRSSQGERANGGKQQAQVVCGFSELQQDFNVLLSMTLLYLEKEALPEEVLVIRLEAVHVALWEASSRHLFGLLGDADAPELGAQLNTHLLDQIKARLGEGACQGIKNTCSLTPESSWGFVSSDLLAKSKKPNPQVSPYIYRKRPLWLSVKPTRVSLKELTLTTGPERIQSQWWSRYVDRDYYIARRANGSECWVFVDTKNRWHIHGYF